MENEILSELQRLSKAIEEQNKMLREIRRKESLESEKICTPYSTLEDCIEEQSKLIKEIRNWMKYTLSPHLESLCGIYAAYSISDWKLTKAIEKQNEFLKILAENKKEDKP